MIHHESQYCLCSPHAWCKEETRSKVLASLSFQLHANLPATWYHIHTTGVVYQYPMTYVTKGNAQTISTRDHESLQFFGSTSRWIPWKRGGHLLARPAGLPEVTSISAKGTIRLRPVSLVKTVDVSLAFLCPGPMPCKTNGSYGRTPCQTERTMTCCVSPSWNMINMRLAC